ncbi:MAG: flagellar M-ring protein FliF [Spirochaetaceae bacterium]|nr:flagellar M-ring protein FliF [Spirochaetaceae bacterium]
MNEFFKKQLGQIGSVWKKLSRVQRGIFAVVIIAAIGGFGLLAAYSSSPSMAPLLYRTVTDDQEMARITQRLDQEGVPYQITADARVFVKDEKTAQRMRGVLVRENIIPAGSDPWDIFDVERWTITDFERNVNLRRAITQDLERHIAALEDVDAARVIIGMPKDTLFPEDREPITVSLTVTPKPGSDLADNRKKREGIERLVRFAIPGLATENITITDNRGIRLNDFSSLVDTDRLDLTRRELMVKKDVEKQYENAITRALQEMYGADRIQLVNLNIEVDTSKKTIKDESHSPIIVTPNNPNTPYDESAEEGAKVLSIVKQEDLLDEKFRGLAFSPEGPVGTEGQLPPGYKDLENLGEYRKSQIEEYRARQQWEVFDVERWAITDFKQNSGLKRRGVLSCQSGRGT